MTAASRLRFDRADALRVLRFDTACGCEGCGGRLRRQFVKNRTTALAGGGRPPEVADSPPYLG